MHLLIWRGQWIGPEIKQQAVHGQPACNAFRGHKAEDPAPYARLNLSIFCRHSTYCDCFQSHEEGDDGCGDEVVENVLLKQTSARQNVKKDTGRSTVKKANAQRAKIIKSAQSEPIALYCIPQCKEAS